METTRKEITIEQFIETAKSIKLTEPGARILERIQQGYTLRVINRHRMNGGEIVWVNSFGQESNAGHIYKAFFNLQHKVSRRLNVWDIKIIGLWN